MGQSRTEGLEVYSFTEDGPADSLDEAVTRVFVVHDSKRTPRSHKFETAVFDWLADEVNATPEKCSHEHDCCGCWGSNGPHRIGWKEGAFQNTWVFQQDWFKNV